MNKFLLWMGKFYILSSTYYSSVWCQFKYPKNPKHSLNYIIKNHIRVRVLWQRSMFHFKLEQRLTFSSIKSQHRQDYVNLTPYSKDIKKQITYLQVQEAVEYWAPILQFWKPHPGFPYYFWLLPSPNQLDLVLKHWWWLKKAVRFSNLTWSQSHW